MSSTPPLQREVPKITCMPLPEFNKSNLESVRGAFANVPQTMLGQAWRDQIETDFAPATVKTAWHGHSLHVFAELSDRDIFNQATGNNQRAWELGDVFEIFLKAPGGERYVELQVTPENKQLQLAYANTAALEKARATGSIQEALIPGTAFSSTTWVEPLNQRWFVLALIPLALVSGTETLGLSDPWRFSFSRYDYTRGRPAPVISSTSPHSEPNFHRQQDWGIMRFSSPDVV
jgi:hypothetical protein